MHRPGIWISGAATVALIGFYAFTSALAANVTEVLVGEVLPLTGNFASLGQQYLWAAQTV
jgi:hypothetical protein